MRTSLLWTAALVGGLLLSSPARGQIWTSPRRPGQSIVRWDPHDWRTIDLLVDEELEAGDAAGLRLYFYEGERTSAERAAVQIESAYRELAVAFRYAPTQRFPYILYNSYAEFLRTNLFPLQEGVLGVTSPRGLEVTLPYFGDHQRFSEVSTHELAHEFTIQKVRAAAEHVGLARDGLPAMPLWFIEGLAEYYAQGGLDPRAALLVRDLVTNPDLYVGHGLLGFFDDFPWSVVWTYQVGLARVTFLEATYGEGTVQSILEASPSLVMNSPLLSTSRRFASLVERLTGDEPETVDAKFQAWIKERAFTEWLDAEQGPAVADRLELVKGWVGALDASPDGEVVAYRSIETDTGRSRLFVTHADTIGRTRRVLAEGIPGTESLHPVDDRNFDLGSDGIIAVAESRGADVLVWRPVRVERHVPKPARVARREARDARRRDRERRRAERRGDEPPSDEAWDPEPPDWATSDPLEIAEWSVSAPPLGHEERVRIRLKLGGRKRIRLARHDVVAAYAPTLSPDGARVAFVGLHRDGQRDVFVVDRKGGGPARRLTDDARAERSLTWGADGIVYTSDATDHGHFNLFRVDPDGGTPERLTTEPRDHLDPIALPDGRLFFGTADDGHGNLHELDAEGPAVRTDMSTGVFEPAPGRDGGLWALMHHQGRRQPVHLDAEALTAGEPRPQPPGEGPAPLATRPLTAATPYRPLDVRNWRPESLFGFVAAGPGGIFGQIYASAAEQLRDRAVVISGLFLGNIRLTDGYLLYVDQSKRITWGFGPFQSVRFPFDETVDPGLLFMLYERVYGGLVSARYPVDRFVYVQVDESLGAAEPFLHPPRRVLRTWDDPYCPYGDCGEALRLSRAWEASSPPPRFQSETTLRVGYDTVRYHRGTGPLAGFAGLVEGTGGFQPAIAAGYGNVRTDLQGYLPLPIGSGANIGLRGSAGTSSSGAISRNFFLSSYDTLRGVTFGDSRFLLGHHFWFGSSELQVPLDALVRVALASSLEGVVGVDFGAVGDDTAELWDKRVLDIALGGNVIVGPLVFRIHFAHPFDIGAPLPTRGRSPWVPNVSLSWLQL